MAEWPGYRPRLNSGAVMHPFARDWLSKAISFDTPRNPQNTTSGPVENDNKTLRIKFCSASFGPSCPMLTRLNLDVTDNVLLVLYLLFGLVYNLHNQKSYRDHHWALPLHVFAGLSELFLYYAGYEIGWISFILCLIQSATNLALAKHLLKGVPSLTRQSLETCPCADPDLMLFNRSRVSGRWHLS